MMTSRASDGSIVLLSKHPKDCLTWHWSVSVTRKTMVVWGWRLWCRDERRKGQWHDYYRLPFGWTLILSAQDYHKDAPVSHDVKQAFAAEKGE